MIELGATYTDRITGFKGVATGYVRYISGCNQVLIVPKVAGEGGYRDPQWFDEQRLDVDPRAKKITLDNSAANGFDAPAPKR